MKKYFEWKMSLLFKCCLGVIFTLNGLFLPVTSWAADSCDVSISVDVGHYQLSDSHTFSELSSINDYRLTDEDRWSYCTWWGIKRYSVEGNILKTESGCVGTFEVTGTLAGCTVDSDNTFEISQNPLFLTGTADANLMFILDDSGSMQFEIMPETYAYMTYMFMYPRANRIYNNSSDYSDYYVPSFEGVYQDAYSALTRSQNNVLYYNPAQTYTPWVDANGDEMADANPAAAWHNPYKPSAGSRDLIQDNSQWAQWVSCNRYGSCSRSSSTRTFYPATYYYYSGSDVWDRDNYMKTEIRASQTHYTGEGRGTRTDCADAENSTCTYEEEIQNFANWYSYYRSRVLASRAGIGRAFAMQGTGLRVGFASLNTSSHSVDGQNHDTIVMGVRAFTGTDRESFFENLYELPINVASTPLRGALKDVGEYYSRHDNKGPWANTPGTDDGTSSADHLECRQSYTVMMTDGYWDTNNDDPNVGNMDGQDGPTINGQGDASFTYGAISPFRDSYSNTLADVAIKYWKNDLRTDLDNKVPVRTLDPAFWQHMSFYGVGFGVEGSVDPDTAFNAISDGSIVSWPSPSNSDSAKIDDLLHASVNGRGGFFSASDPNTLANELADMLSVIATQTTGSSTNMTVNSVELNTDTLVYQAQFDSSDWSGHLIAYDAEEVNGDLDLSQRSWDAAAQLPDEDERNILTHSGGSGTGNGLYFKWNGSYSLTNEQKAILDNTEYKLTYLRGGDDLAYRQRSSKLGDIVNSDPVYVEDDDYGYSSLSGVEGAEYDQFVLDKMEHASMLYVGANDGMLHGFDAVTGVERFAYVPNAVFNNLPNLLNQEYVHQYFVDGEIHVSDAYIDRGRGEEWRTVLIGGLGAGGKAIYALDITDPEGMTANDVLWEFTEADDEDLGYTFGSPTIARLYDGTWAAIFGNGYGSANGKAVLYIVNLETGALIKKIDVEKGDNSDTNGLSGPVYYYSTSSNGSTNTTYAGNIYAGDLQGNLWKFYLSSSNSNSWDVAFIQGNTKYPLFTAINGSAQRQSITSNPELKRLEEGGMMVLFGTGRYLNSADVNDLSIQSVYGIRDIAERIEETDRSTLQEQEIIYEGTAYGQAVRSVTNNIPDWSVDRGWYLDLISPLNGAEGERVVQSPELWFERLGIATLIPSDDPCDPGTDSWYMELDYSTGGRLTYSVFDVNDDNQFDNDDYVDNGDGQGNAPVSGVSGGGVGNMPAKIGDNLVKSEDDIVGYDLGLENVKGRLSWREKR